MHTLEERMGAYAAYHKDPRNKFTHLFGVPMVFYSPLIALGWLRIDMLGVEISLAIVILTLVMLWYLKLDWKFGATMTLISIPIAYACDIVSRMDFSTSLAIFLSVKIVGW